MQGGEFLFKQIYDYVLHRIELNEWNEHDKLPSIRKLAADMKANRLTVLKAYQLLKEQNKIYAKEKSGYYVQAKERRAIIHDSAPIVPAYIQTNQLSDIHRVPVSYNFSQALIDPNLLPNRFFSNYVKNVFDLYPKVLATYAPLQGDEELRDALARYLNDQYRMITTADQLLITTGSQQAIYLIAQTFIKQRDTVLIERPSYSAAIDVFRAQGANIVTVEIHPDGYDLEQVEHMMKTYKPRLFYMNPTFHNPTGYTVPSLQRKHIVQLAEQYRCLLIEDDAYHDIYFHEAPPPPIYTYDTVGTVVYIRSFCKYISPGLRTAVMVCPEPLMESILSVKSLVDNGCPLLNQKMFLHYFSSPRMQQHLEKLRIAIQIRKEVMEETLFMTDWKWISPGGGLSLWVQLPVERSAEQILSASVAQSVSFVPGHIFDPVKQPSLSVRLSYSFANENQIRIGMQKLIRVVQSLHYNSCRTANNQAGQ